MMNYIYYFLYHLLWQNVVHARIVALCARLVAIDRAGTARQVNLHGIVDALVPAHEARIRVCGAPDAYHLGAHERCQVHIGAVHAEHDVETTHQHQFAMQTAHNGRRVGASGVSLLPLFKHGLFVFSASEEEDAALWHLLCEQVDHLFHLFNGIHLALMCGKGCYAYPLLPLGPIANEVCNGGKEAAIVVREDRGKLWGDGVAQLSQHIGISFKRCGYGL